MCREEGAAIQHEYGLVKIPTAIIRFPVKTWGDV